MLEAQAKTLVYAFANLAAKGVPVIGDSRELPQSKPLLKEAFNVYMDGLEELRKFNPTLFNAKDCQSELEQVFCVSQFIDNWHDIDPEDIEAVRKLNSLGPDDPEMTADWAWTLTSKYIARQTE